MKNIYLSLISLFEYKLDNNFGTEGVYGKDVAKIGQQQDRCHNEIGFRAQNMNIITP